MSRKITETLSISKICNFGNNHKNKNNKLCASLR